LWKINNDNMFDELNKYEDNNHFFFESKDELAKVCNAPTNKFGGYIVYALERGKVRLVYIGESGEVNTDGIKETIVNRHQVNKENRNKIWSEQINKEGIHASDIYWFVTHSEKHLDLPSDIERVLINKYKEIYGELPRWNKK